MRRENKSAQFCERQGKENVGERKLGNEEIKRALVQKKRDLQKDRK